MTDQQSPIADAAADAPQVPYWHVWTDSDGISRQTKCMLTSFKIPKADAWTPDQKKWDFRGIWQGLEIEDDMKIIFLIQPVGWVGTWHENPAPQWLIPISGRWFVETMDGTRVEMGPGDLSLGEDQGCVMSDGKRGHLSGTVGDEPLVLMVVQMPKVIAPKQACPYV
jgi:hypothetical protein